MNILLGIFGTCVFLGIVWGLVYLAMHIDEWVGELGDLLFDGKGCRSERIWPFVVYILLYALALIFRIIEGLIILWAAYSAATAVRDWWHEGKRD